MNTNETNEMNEIEIEEYGTSELRKNGMTFTIGPAKPVVEPPPEGEAAPSAAPQAEGAAPAETNPRDALWAGAEERFPAGSKLKGKVVNFKPYGVFVETEEGLFGLVHGSQIAGWNWKRRFDSVFRLDEEIEVTVTKVDAEAHRMAFSYELPPERLAAMNAPPPPPPEPEEPPRRLDRSECAVLWTEENPELSDQARNWLRTELEDGPFYGPLSGVLNEKFDVPVPVSYWVRLFPEFTCFTVKGDNPSGLPAIALTARANDDAYWKRFKAKRGDLAHLKTKEDEFADRYLPVLQKLGNIPSFPGSAWIRRFMRTASRFQEKGSVFGTSDALERLVVPLLGELGWPVSGDDASSETLVRSTLGGFNLRISDASGKLTLALICEDAATSFHSLRDRAVNATAFGQRNVIERVFGICNGERSYADGVTKVIWTNGLEWIVFKQAGLARRIGVISDRSGAAILDETKENDDNDWFNRVVVPTGDNPLDFLAAFADLAVLIGREG